LHAAANAHDAQAVAALRQKDVVWEDPATPEPLLGREAVYHFHRDKMWPFLLIVQGIPECIFSFFAKPRYVVLTLRLPVPDLSLGLISTGLNPGFPSFHQMVLV